MKKRVFREKRFEKKFWNPKVVDVVYEEALKRTEEQKKEAKPKRKKKSEE